MSNGASVTLQSHRAAIEAELQQRIAAHQRLMLSRGLVANRVLGDLLTFWQTVTLGSIIP
jgi:hypothetical protein